MKATHSRLWPRGGFFFSRRRSLLGFTSDASSYSSDPVGAGSEAASFRPPLRVSARSFLLSTTGRLQCPAQVLPHPGNSSPVPAKQIEDAYLELQSSVQGLLDDRRVLYRDQTLLDVLSPHRDSLKALLCSGTANPGSGAAETVSTVGQIRRLHSYWSDRLGSQAFYSVLLSSSLVQTDAHIRLVLAEASREGAPPSPRVYEAILSSLPVVCVGVGKAAAEDTVLGQAKVISRDTMGDLAGYYMGLSLKQQQPKAPCGVAGGPSESLDRLWGVFLIVSALAHVAPRLMDRWWATMTEGRGEAESGRPLPFTAVHAAIAWSASARDVERSLRFFHEANQRGVSLCQETDARCRDTLAQPGSLTRCSEAAAVQHAQLRMLAKLMETVKSVKRDGGLRALVVADLKKLIPPHVLQREAPWGVVSDVLGGLSIPSAMQLVKRCSRCRAGGEADVPFEVWAALLRRCARERRQDEANALFLFVRKRFRLTEVEKRELVEIMLRMDAAMGDFASAMDLFVTHVLSNPENEPAVKADVTLYNLLIRAADSRNAAMMVFLEACAAGVGMDRETFDGLLAANPFHNVARLSRRLPFDFMSSALDSQLRIPNDADAHARREEALKSRGKPLFDSTGESG